MDDKFTCRNTHCWRLSVEDAFPINPRWVSCPVCGAPPVPTAPLSWWQQLRRWVWRNPTVACLIASVATMMTAFALVLTGQRIEIDRARKEAQDALEDALRQAGKLEDTMREPDNPIVPRTGTKR